MGTACPYSRFLSPPAFGQLPLIRGVVPLDPIYGSRQLGNLCSNRKGAGGSTDRPLLVFRCRSAGSNRDVGTPLSESAFVRMVLNCGSTDRRAADSRPYEIRRTFQSFCRGPAGAHCAPLRR